MGEILLHTDREVMTVEPQVGQEQQPTKPKQDVVPPVREVTDI